ncbi:hypothetical protein [Nocardioides xinjiangensis]|uniref:hypothetical protein n=1 Tax=Nocardioides xinjiangensis TaxID=2817376 RepID=UPI001B307AC3|nr:hypothetical protein [Nocardioides sp. SYSU D00514]
MYAQAVVRTKSDVSGSTIEALLAGVYGPSKGRRLLADSVLGEDAAEILAFSTQDLHRRLVVVVTEPRTVEIVIECLNGSLLSQCETHVSAVVRALRPHKAQVRSLTVIEERTLDNVMQGSYGRMSSVDRRAAVVSSGGVLLTALLATLDVLSWATPVAVGIPGLINGIVQFRRGGSSQPHWEVVQ